MGKDMSNVAGIPVFLDEINYRLEFSGGLKEMTPDIRTSAQALDVLYNPANLGEEDLYFMYRGVGSDKAKNLWQQFNLRYDLTLLKPLVIGGELNKTVGHYHPEVGDSGLTYPEVYEVIYGEAHYLLQKVEVSEEAQRAVKVVVIKAYPGDKVLIPPGYGHITINPSKENPLLMSNITADGFKSIYEPFKEVKGGAYFELESGEWVKNKNYLEVNDLEFGSSYENSKFGLEKDISLYQSCFSGPEKFRYLTHPSEFDDLWKELD
ncbi:MAG: glucose-6-phosphate isomerase [Actinomycetia bacterium]|nr:glucose-6-phosphate isomerase [Actinomycetes bacterium]